MRYYIGVSFALLLAATLWVAALPGCVSPSGAPSTKGGMAISAPKARVVERAEPTQYFTAEFAESEEYTSLRRQLAVDLPSLALSKSFGMLPKSIGTLSSLKELSITHNDISYLPESIKNLENLKHIYVRGTKITQAPKFLKIDRFDDPSKTIYL